MIETICFCSKVRRASRVLMKLYDQALEPLDLTIMQFAALRIALRLNTPTLPELAEATGHDRSAMWRALQPLAKRKLVDMGATPRQSSAITVTAKGKALVKKATPLWSATQTKLDRAVGTDTKKLFAALTKIEALNPTKATRHAN
jgi:DNA-binding MarR family transcriptional regulator